MEDLGKYKKLVNIRGGDDDLGIDEMLVEGRVLALLIRGGDQGVALVLQPFANAELVLCRTKQLRDLKWGGGGEENGGVSKP